MEGEKGRGGIEEMECLHEGSHLDFIGSAVPPTVRTASRHRAPPTAASASEKHHSQPGFDADTSATYALCHRFTHFFIFLFLRCRLRMRFLAHLSLIVIVDND